MKFLELVCLICLLVAKETGSAQWQYGESQFGHMYRDEYKNRDRNCPEKCRCVSQDQLGLRRLGQGWRSVTQERKGTSVGQEDTMALQGKNVVCTGLTKVPFALPDGRLI